MRGGDAAGGGAGQVPVPGRGLAARPARVPAQGLPRAQVRVAACREYLTRVMNNICWQPPPRHALAARPRPCPARRPPHRHLPLRLQARRRRHAALRPRYTRSKVDILQLSNKQRLQVDGTRMCLCVLECRVSCRKSNMDIIPRTLTGFDLHNQPSKINH